MIFSRNSWNARYDARTTNATIPPHGWGLAWTGGEKNATNPKNQRLHGMEVLFIHQGVGMMPGGQVPLAGRNASVVDGQDAKNKCDFVDDRENHDLLDDYDNRYGHNEHNDP